MKKPIRERPLKERKALGKKFLEKALDPEVMKEKFGAELAEAVLQSSEKLLNYVGSKIHKPYLKGKKSK